MPSQPTDLEHVFLCYRRRDSESATLLLYEKLANHLGAKRVFWDGNMGAGEDWRERLETVLARCRVFVAVIGHDWLTAVDNSGRHRLQDPNDWVRMEIATALRRGVRVIPTLVEGAQMPTAEELPEDLQRLPSCHAIQVDARRWTYDAERFLNEIDSALAITSTRQLSTGDSFAGYDIEDVIDAAAWASSTARATPASTPSAPSRCSPPSSLSTRRFSRASVRRCASPRASATRVSCASTTAGSRRASSIS